MLEEAVDLGFGEDGESEAVAEVEVDLAGEAEVDPAKVVTE
jgi:hypothetical protein